MVNIATYPIIYNSKNRNQLKKRKKPSLAASYRPKGIFLDPAEYGASPARGCVVSRKKIFDSCTLELGDKTSVTDRELELTCIPLAWMFLERENRALLQIFQEVYVQLKPCMNAVTR